VELYTELFYANIPTFFAKEAIVLQWAIRITSCDFKSEKKQPGFHVETVHKAAIVIATIDSEFMKPVQNNDEIAYCCSLTYSIATVTMLALQFSTTYSW